MTDTPDRAAQLAHLAYLTAEAEKAYDAMYDSRYPTGPYADAKDWFREAIALARSLELTSEAEALSQRLEHVRAVFRSQFS